MWSLEEEIENKNTDREKKKGWTFKRKKNSEKIFKLSK